MESIDAELRVRYEPIELVGKGVGVSARPSADAQAYGEVWKAMDRKTHGLVALKRCYEAFRNATDAQRTYREVMHLQTLSGHDNIIRLFNVLCSQSGRDVYLVQEFFETDLSAIIRRNLLDDSQRQFIFYQILRGVKYIHSAKIMHRDIKPANILLNSDCHITLCDFGLCRVFGEKSDPSGDRLLTDYIATRWYRAPELLLGSTDYDQSVDVWALGCLLAELLTGRPLFPGSSTLNQLERIFEAVGWPKKDEIPSFRSPHTDAILSVVVQREFISLRRLLPEVTDAALDLIAKCLRLNPRRRLKIEDALTHPYMAVFHRVDDEPKCTRVSVIELSDDHKHAVDDYRQHLFTEIDRLKI